MKHCQPAILFCDGCVLQRQKPIVVFGTGTENETVVVRLDGNEVSCVVKDGKWECELPPMEAAQGLSLSISCAGEEQVISNVSIGEVWIAAGQSNMEFNLRYDSQWEKIKELPGDARIHMFNVPRLIFDGQEEMKDVSDSGYWFEEGDKAWPLFSTIGYVFAREILKVLDVPVGIIGCNWGGTSASVWIDETKLEKEPVNVYLREYEDAVRGKDTEKLIRQEIIAARDHDSPERRKEWTKVMYGLSLEEQEAWVLRQNEDPPPENPVGPYSTSCPGRLYHRMLELVIPYEVRGVLWYQGETDDVHAEIYDVLFTEMIRCWRESFRQDLPFLFVQLAPFGRWLDCKGTRYPVVRDRQDLVERTVPGTYMVSIMDLGMYEDIHPKKKAEIGRRLALLARNKVYGEEELLCSPPSIRSAKKEGDCIVLSFDQTGDGLIKRELLPEKETEASIPSELTGPAEQKEGFLLKYDGKPLHIDKVEILKDTILIFSDELEKAMEQKDTGDHLCELSFACVPYICVSIYNSSGFSMKPFRCIV